MRLMKRVADLEQRLSPPSPSQWVSIIQDADQTREQAVTAWAAEHGPLGDRNTIMGVVVG
ncbi:MAG: hypothetical protein ABIS10_01190 [Novosphingobium sp.]